MGVVITLALVGRRWRPKAAKAPAKAVQSLIKLRPRTAQCSTPLPQTMWTASNGVIRRISTDTDIDAIATGDLVVKNGERVPTDGVIVAGEARIDESMITGESKPVSKTAGDPVTGATVLLKGGCVMRHPSRRGHGTFADRGDGGPRPATKAPVQQLADKIARYFVPAVMIIAIWTFAMEVTWPGAATGARAGHRGQCADHRPARARGTGLRRCR